jgi:hypothetical protein
VGAVRLVEKVLSKRLIMDIFTHELLILPVMGREFCTAAQGLNIAVAIRM